MRSIISKFFGSEIHKEVVQAYLQKLPQKIQVAWMKDEGFIVGKIFIGDDKDPVFTQAKSPEEFVKMVNDAVYIALDFKPEYIEFFHKKKDIFLPPEEDWKKLANKKEKEGVFGTLDIVEQKKLVLA